MRLRVTLMTLAGALLLTVAALFAYALAAARVPQQRAAIEDLLRAETGLDVRFNEMVLRWGWYGPEVVVRRVALGEPGEEHPLLTASRLVAGVDLWRLLRNGELQIDRLTLIDPDIDLTRIDLTRAPPRAARGEAAAVPSNPLRLLARWRGARLDVLGGTLRAGNREAPFSAGIRSLQLRRAGSEWSARGLLALPPALGAAAELTLRGNAAEPEDLSGTVSITGRQLELAGWHALLEALPGSAYLPRAGSGNVTVSMVLAHGALTRAEGSLRAEALSWTAADSTAAGLGLPHVHAEWQLVRSAAGWRLAVQPLTLGGAPDPPAAVDLEAAADGAWVHGRVQHAPVSVLAGLARTLDSRLAMAAPMLDGTVREASFDWSRARPPEERLRTLADIEDLTVAVPRSTLKLAGLEGHLSGEGRGLIAELHADKARVSLADDPDFSLAPLSLSARLELEGRGAGWRFATRNLEIRAADAQLRVSATLAADAASAHPYLDAHATLGDAPVETVRRLLGPKTLAALGDAGVVTAGRIERAELLVRGSADEPLPWSGPHRELSGSLVLRDARLAATPERPELQGVDARIDWHGTRVAVHLSDGASGGLKVVRAKGEWDVRDASLVRLSGRLAGGADEALAWLKSHPPRAGYAAALEGVELRGGTVLDFDLERAGTRFHGAGAPRFTTRVTALLDGARLRPLAGLPAIEALRGTLAFADGRLQRSTVSGQWLGGPIALTVGERTERGVPTLAIAGRGLADARQAMVASGARGEDGVLEGNAEWSAELKIAPAEPGRPARLTARAESSLVGVASRLPEPFAKAAGTTLGMRAELAGTLDAGELRVALGERLRGRMALKRRGELWQIERGGVRFGSSPPALPAVPAVRIEGSLSRLDLPAYAALWRGVAHNPAWPSLRVELNTAELVAAGASWANVRLAADSGAEADVLRLESPDLAGVLRLPAAAGAANPASVHLERLDIPETAAAAGAAALLGSLAPNAALEIDDLRWQGHPLGMLTAHLAMHSESLELSEAHLAAAADEARGALRCQASCSATFSLESRDAAGLLARLGMPAGVSAARTRVSGELDWPARGAPAWAGVTGLLHVELDQGLARAWRAAGSPDTAMGLLAVPGLIAALGVPELPFSRLSADFTVGEAQAFTSDLHLDGDTEILMRGRIGLTAGDYDAQVWVLKGESRLPAAVRSLLPGPRVAALWLSLRDLFTGAAHERAALRLRGTWNDPMVTEP